LVNKGFITWLSGKFFMRDTAGSPERARWLHLARPGSQSQRAIWFILPARGASHIITVIIIRQIFSNFSLAKSLPPDSQISAQKNSNGLLMQSTI